MLQTSGGLMLGMLLNIVQTRNSVVHLLQLMNNYGSIIIN